jgi:predicted SAM-dependent methyltransferase
MTIPKWLRKPLDTVVGIAARARFNLCRWRLARRYLRGSGLEVGALHRPLRLRRDVQVRYVDRMDNERLREHYPELSGEDLVPVDILDDGEQLSSQADSSVDFVIANHFIEHTEDPLGTLANHLRVLRPGGILYLAVPDRHRSFDSDREGTPLEHVVRDHVEGPEWSRTTHHEEWARLVEKAPAEEVAARARSLEERRYSIHFHVWNGREFEALLDHAREQARLPFTIETLTQNGHEFIAILRRVSA